MLRKILPLLLIAIFIPSSCKRAVAESVQKVTPAQVKENIPVEKVIEDTVPGNNAKKESRLINDKKLILNEDYRVKILKMDKLAPISIFSLNKDVDERAIQILKNADFKNIYILKNGLRQKQ